MKASGRAVAVAAAVLLAVVVGVALVGYKLVGSGVDDPEGARCPDPAIMTDATRSSPAHRKSGVARNGCGVAARSHRGASPVTMRCVDSFSGCVGEPCVGIGVRRDGGDEVGGAGCHPPVWAWLGAVDEVVPVQRPGAGDRGSYEWGGE